MKNPKKYLNHLDIEVRAEGNERRYEMLKDILKNGTFTPRPVLYKDIDSAFSEWVENELKISYNNKVLPTMVLYSNQRFTEYSQTWQYTDENKNLILNFKTITRENDPEYGKIQSGLWNIPGERFYHMKRIIVLDNNGSESFLDLEMKQPMAVDFIYTVSVFSTNFETINEFNLLVNDRFKARQAYIRPNGHFMPMTLEDISDKSSYAIDDRQFYSQSYSIKVMGYVIKEDDYRVSERPLKKGAKFRGGILKKKHATIEVEEEEYVNPCNKPEKPEEHYFKPIYYTITFPDCVKETEFDMDSDFVLTGSELNNTRRFLLKVNDVEITSGSRINEGDTVNLTIVRLQAGKESVVRLVGYDPRIAYDVKNDTPEITADETNIADEYIIDV